MSWIVFAIVSTLLFSVTALLTRTLMKGKGSDPYAHSVFFQLIVAGLLFLFVSATSGFSVAGIENLIPNVVLMMLLYGVANIALNNSFKRLDAAEVQIFLASSALWSSIGAIIFLGESMTMVRLIGIVCIIIGASIISWHGGKLKFRAGMYFGIATSLLFGFAVTNDGIILSNLENIPSYLTLGFLLPGLFLLILKPSSLKKFSYYRKGNRLFQLFAVAIAYAGGSAAFWYAFKAGGDVSQIAPISQSSVVLTVLFAHFFLGEKDRLSQKILGAVLTFGGVLLVS